MIKQRFEFTQNTDFRAVPKVQRETLKALRLFFGGFQYENAENEVLDIRCVYAHPERVIAKLHGQENTIVLPIISVGKGSIEIDDERRRYKGQLVHNKYWDEEKQRAVRIVSRPSRPIKINYDIMIWAKYRDDLDSTLEQFYRQFNPDIEVVTPFSTTTKAFIVAETDVSELEAPDGADRLLRKGITIEVQTYIPSPKYLFTNTGAIEETKVEFEFTELPTSAL